MSNHRLSTGAVLGRYLRDRAPLAGVFVLCALTFAVICYLTGAPLSGVAYACALLGVVGLLALALDWSRYLRRHRQLETLAQRALLLDEPLPAARGLIEADWQRLLTCTLAHASDEQEQRLRERRERDEYAAMWTHQIKVPIAAMRLLLQADPDERSTALGAELFRIEQYVEMSHNYARLTGAGTDFVLRPCRLDSLMKRCARRFAPLFIHKKLTLDYRPTTLTALTDEKWLAFVLEQLLSNAVKYTSRGSVTLRCDEARELLIVEDTGIGIAPEDLPRVFEHGFTGLNGRMDKRATGLGLYLSRRVLTMLGHSIHLESQPGRGTRAVVSLHRDSLGME